MRKIFDPRGGVYHCMSRCVQGRRLLNKPEQEIFRRQLFQAADFSGLEIITYCIMSNHFHVLVRAPSVDTPVSDDELIRRYQVLYPKASKFTPLPLPSLVAALERDDEAAEAIRQQLLRRMHDVSEFMRTVKLRFSLWYNRTHETFGAFWSSRFHSVLVEDKPSMVRTVAAYIDLNPVRAGLVKDPKAYRYCGYAEAVVGKPVARAGICGLMHHQASDDVGRMAAYRSFLFGRGAKGVRGKAEFSEEDVTRVYKEEGQLPMISLLATRLKFFTEGVVLGSNAFVASYGEGKVRSPHPVLKLGQEAFSSLKGVRKRKTG